jgi:hypothetical protein
MALGSIRFDEFPSISCRFTRPGSADRRAKGWKPVSDFEPGKTRVGLARAMKTASLASKNCCRANFLR